MSDDRTDHDHVSLTPTFGGRLSSAPGADAYRRAPPRLDGTVLLRASGEFDRASVGCLRQALKDARHDAAARILLDLTAVTFGDSAFLHTLLTARRNPVRPVLVGPLPGHLRRFLRRRLLGGGLLDRGLLRLRRLVHGRRRVRRARGARPSR
ncbi:STAS domain-containing protein [Streptomyces sp. NPDC097704]|uniref:STAS domain-containing protein n=1 Tax=Streptomyces sp. NPDC097704 TaxID=3157101 RepID=UPI00331DE452